MLTGENGILTQARKAKSETENAQEKEETTLGQYESYINQATNTEAVVGEIVTGGNKPYTNNGTAIIPEGFMIVPGCNDVSQGLVISDNPDDTEENSSNIIAKGNQFVWIPVTSENEYVRNTTYENKNVSATAYTDTGYLPNGIAPTIPDNITDEKEIGLLNEVAERNATVSKGGFYISRYEAGNDGSDKLISKKGTTVWTNKTQEEFKKIGKSFEVKSPEKVKSAMCSGIQWDIAMKFITENDENYDVINATDSWHQGSKVVTSGQNEEDKACNIYDLESNVFEYVAERGAYSIDEQFITRGSDYNNSYSASYRGDNNGYAYSYDSFRFVLYVM